MRGSRSGAFNYSRRTIPPLVSFGDYIYEYLFASPFSFLARCFHRSAVSNPPNPLRSRVFLALSDVSARDFSVKSRGKNVMWSVKLVEPAVVKFPKLFAGMSLYHCGQVRKLSGKVHLIAFVFVDKQIKLYLRKSIKSNSYLLLNRVLRLVCRTTQKKTMLYLYFCKVFS